MLTRQNLSETTPTLSPGAAHDYSLAAGRLFHLLELEASQPCWLRVYGTSDARSADSRTTPAGTLPAAGSGFYAELVITSADQRLTLAPVPLVQAPEGSAYLRVVNTGTAAAVLSLQHVVLTLEDIILG